MTDTTLADKIEALVRTYDKMPVSASYERVHSAAIDIANCASNHLPTILRALRERERDQAVEALRQYGTHGAGCSGYNDECSCGLAETLARIEGTGHE